MQRNKKRKSLRYFWYLPNFLPIHADSPTLMYDRLAQMVMRFGTPLRKEEIIDYAKSLIQVVIQLKRDHQGRRYLSEVLYEGN